jgi:hypothetical protein
MKILVNEMPYFLGECPFYDYSTCKLDGEHCEQFDPPCGERNLEECPHLMTLETYKKEGGTKS